MPRMPVVITKSVYAKGEAVFGDASGRYDWKILEPAEAGMAEAVSAWKSRIAVLGVERYEGPLYEALNRSAGGKPSLIMRYGVGTDGIDLRKCRESGVLLAITRGTLDRSVAEHAMSLILACARHIAFLDREMRSGRFTPRQGVELAGKTLVLLGFGQIAKRLSPMAAFGFGMKVIAFDHKPLEKAAALEGLPEAAYQDRYGLSEYSTEYHACAARADFLSLHLAVRPDTVDFINADSLAAMKTGAYLINTARGRLVDEAALYDALEAGRIRGAGLDVFRKEPYEPVSPERDLRRLPNVVLTGHVGSNTLEANLAMQEKVLQNLDAYAAGALDRMTLVKT